MTLDKFKQKMKNDRYSNEYIELIDDRLLMFDFFKNEIHDVTNYEDDNDAITHASFERLLNKKIEVLSFMRDAREDWGDDGGFTMFVGKHKDKYIFGSFIANYNLEFSDEFINSDNISELDEGIDYKTYESLDDIAKEVEKIISLAEQQNAEDCDYEIIPATNDKFIINIFENFGSAFWEYYEENIELMRKLTDMNNKYVPRLYDDVNFYHSWIERQENTFVCKV